MRGLVVFLVLVVVALAGVAFYRNWIVVLSQPGKDSTDINIKVDRSKAREDLREAREETRELAQKAREKLVGTTSTVEGEIMAVDSQQRHLKLMISGQEQTIRVDKDAAIERDKEKIGLDALKVGEKISAKVKEENGEKVAQSITVNPTS